MAFLQQKTLLNSKNIAVLTAFVISGVYAAYCFSLSHSTAALVFASIVIACDIVLYVAIDQLYNRHILSVDKAFVIILSFLGLLFCFVFVPGSVPDEFYHYLASYRYSDSALFQQNDVTGLMMRADDASFYNNALSSVLNQKSYSNLADACFLAQDTSPIFVEKWDGSDFGNNLPQQKLASAIGILFGRLLGLGSYPVFYLGRLFNLGFFVVLVYFAVRVMPFGKNIMRVVAMLPMTLHLAASYSYDAGIIGMAFLLTAFCLKAIYGNGFIEKRTCVAILVLTALLAPCKIVYFAISLSALLIPSKRFSCKKNARLFKLGVIGLGVLAIVLIRMPALVSMSGVEAEEYTVSRGDEAGQFYTLSEVLNNPLKFILIFARTAIVMADNYLYTMLGKSLGWFQEGIDAPWFFTIMLLLIVIASSVPTPADKNVARPSHRIIFLLICCLIWLGLHLSMLIGWTFNTSPIIQGIQGRYFLPCLPLALLALRNSTFICKRNISWALMFGLLLLNSVYMIQVFSIALAI